MQDFEEFASRVDGDSFVNKVLLRRRQLRFGAQPSHQEKEEMLRQRDVVLTMLKEYHEWVNGR